LKEGVRIFSTAGDTDFELKTTADSKTDLQKRPC